ncbi:MAG: hypothetical protein ACTHJ4_01175 [Candidatus Nucleicultricaceae bacterium]
MTRMKLPLLSTLSLLLNPASLHASTLDTSNTPTSKILQEKAITLINAYMSKYNLNLEDTDFDQLKAWDVDEELVERQKEAFTDYKESNGQNPYAKAALLDLTELDDHLEVMLKNKHHAFSDTERNEVKTLSLKLKALSYTLSPSKSIGHALLNHFNGFGADSEESEIFRSLIP